MTPRVLQRPDWTDYDPTCLSPIPATLDVYVHHETGVCSGDYRACLRRTEDFHRFSRGMCAGAYNMAADDPPESELAVFRGLLVAGGHTLDHNSTSHAIVAYGNWDVREVPDQLVWDLGDGIVWMIEQRAVRPNPRILGHRDYGGPPTACPGRYLYARLPDVRDVVAQGGSGNTPGPIVIPRIVRGGDPTMDGHYDPTEGATAPVHEFHVTEDGALRETYYGVNTTAKIRKLLPAGSCLAGVGARVRVVERSPVPTNDYYLHALAADGRKVWLLAHVAGGWTTLNDGEPK